MTGPEFNRVVPEGGYAWWYVDAFSDDGRHGLTVIAFVGSVFSPYYWMARREGGDPENFVHDRARKERALPRRHSVHSWP
jgi:carotenoid 1,2-hydratase